MDKKDYRVVSDLVEVPLDKLHIRYIPMSRLERWYKPENGYRMMALVNSPHVEIMQLFQRYGLDYQRLLKTRYAKERLSRVELGMAEWTLKHLKVHFDTRYKFFRSVQKNGFVVSKCWDKKKRRDRSVLVCKEPFWCSRFGPIDGIGGWEIYNGAGRAASMLVLGYSTIPAKFIEDRKPGSKQWKNVTKRFE
jgi:hypothetical protein